MFLFKHVQVDCVTLLYHSNKDIKTFILTYYVVVMLTICLVFCSSFPDPCVLQCENILCYVCSLKSFDNKGIRGILFLMWCCCLCFGLFLCVLYCSIYIHLFDISYTMYHAFLIVQRISLHVWIYCFDVAKEIVCLCNTFLFLFIWHWKYRSNNVSLPVLSDDPWLII